MQYFLASLDQISIIIFFHSYVLIKDKYNQIASIKLLMQPQIYILIKLLN